MADVINNDKNIVAGLRADVMRKAIETKDLLTSKGSIYVGTGTKETVDNYDLYKTDALPVGTNGKILCADNNQTLGVHWREINVGTPSSGEANLLTLSNTSTGIVFSLDCTEVEIW